MSSALRRLLVISCLVASIALVGQFTSANPTAQQPQRPLPLKSGGRYQVASAGDSAVLLDSQTGDTWYLRLAKDVEPPRPTWVAIKRQQDGQGRAPLEKPEEFENRLLEAQLQLAKLKDAFGARHPQVIEKQREVDALKKLLQGK